MSTAVRPAKTSPGPWDAFADVDVFVDEVLAEFRAMARDGARPPLTGATLRRAVMAIWCVCFCCMQWRAIGQLCDILFNPADAGGDELSVSAASNGLDGDAECLTGLGQPHAPGQLALRPPDAPEVVAEPSPGDRKRQRRLTRTLPPQSGKARHGGAASVGCSLKAHPLRRPEA
jgi:hypothetical protein